MTARRRWFDWSAVALLVVNLLLRLPNLGHSSVKPLDEVFHAIVASHLLHHPLTPTLNENNFLKTPATDWQNAHVWLHKPPMALWQIACSFAAFGVNTFALRFPSALLCTAAAGLTYLIARELFDPLSAIIALLLQSFNPTLEMLVHGYVFSDHVDISLLFWTELSIYWMLSASRHRSTRMAILCGACQGIAFLSKTYPALITTGLAGALFLFPKWMASDGRKFSGKQLGCMFLATAAVVLPWNLYAGLHWPQEFAAQNLGILSHLNRDVEGWAGPWDRVVADYWLRIFHNFYPLAIAAFLLAAVRGVRSRDTSLLLVIAWVLAALLPNLVAVSKPMTATLVGWPAMFLLSAWLMGRVYQRSAGAAVAFAIAVSCPLIVPLHYSTQGWGYPSGYRFGSILFGNPSPIIAGVLAATTGMVVERLNLHWNSFFPTAGAIASVVLCITTPLGPGYVSSFGRVSSIDSGSGVDANLADYIHRLPGNSVILVDERSKLENKLIQFAAGRDCWPLVNEDWSASAEQIVRGGGMAFVLADSVSDLPVVFDDASSGRKLFATSPAAATAAQAASHVMLEPHD